MSAAETAVREIVGKSKMDFVLYEGREQIAQCRQADAGHPRPLQGRYPDLQGHDAECQPPEQVQSAFDDAVKAGQDRERQKNEGQAYANDVIPKGQGRRTSDGRSQRLSPACRCGRKVMPRVSVRCRPVRQRRQKSPGSACI